MDIPKFETKKELFEFLVKNKDTLMTNKKAQMKKADGIEFISINLKDDSVDKANKPFIPEGGEFKVKVAINTTNYMDSHDDCHLPGIWKKSLKENKFIMHVQEHVMKFDHIISNKKDLKTYTQTFSWKDLGFNFEGNTEALIFDSNVKKKRNEYMFDQYSEGYVDSHSVGMIYVKMMLGINDENHATEYEIWEKYSKEIANIKHAEDRGFCWFIKEAKVIEGSAVPIGSNTATPTIDNNIKTQPLDNTANTDNQPPDGTEINYKYLIEKI